jgi:hypothetical protein
MVIAALGHRVGRVLGSVVARGRDPTEAALALLEGIPLEGRMVTLDVGWMTQPVVRKEVEKGGATWGRSSGRSWKGGGQGFPVFHGCGPMSKVKPRSALALRALKPSTTNR